MPRLPEQNLDIAAPRTSRAPSARAMTEVGRAAGDFARSMSRAGDDLDQAMFEMQDFQDKGTIAEVRSMMLTEQAGHQEFREKNLGNEAEWGTDWKQRQEKVRGHVGQLQLLPQNQERLKQIVGEWEARSGEAVAADMRGHTLKRSVQSYENNLTQYREEKNFDGMRETVPDMPGATPEEKDAALLEIDHMEAEHIRRLKADYFTNLEDPWQFEEIKEQLEADPDFDDAEKNVMRRKLERGMDVHISELLESVDTSFESEDDFLNQFPGWVPVIDQERMRRQWQKRGKLLSEAEKKQVQALLDDLNDSFHEDGKPVDEEAYMQKRHEVGRQLHAFFQRPETGEYKAMWGRTSVASQRQRFRNWWANKLGEDEDAMNNQVDLHMSHFAGILKNDPKRYGGFEDAAKEDFKRKMPLILQSNPAIPFQDAFGIWEADWVSSQAALDEHYRKGKPPALPREGKRKPAPSLLPPKP